MKVLIVEDDSKVARFLMQTFTEGGYAVDCCDRGNEAIAQAATGVYEVIILDWMLPDLDGLAACRAMRRAGVSAPIVMLTARVQPGEQVLALDAGADDYLTKPFEIDVLLARVRAVVRRTSSAGKLKYGDLEVDQIGHRAFLLGRQLPLTSREFALLLLLAKSADQIVTRTELTGRLWSSRLASSSNIVDVHVSRLRQKLGSHRWMIEAVRGKGYRLRTQSSR